MTLAVMAVAPAAQAGGLFGRGGLIRGSVGNFMDRHIEKPITTPLARGAVVAGGAAVGAYFAGEAGAVGGAMLGHGLNRVAAGQRAIP
jgi:hypothetical protein